MEILTFDTHWQLSAITSPFKFTQQHSSKGCLCTSEKNLRHRVLEASKKQVPVKSYSLEIRTDSVNQIFKNKEKGTKIRNVSILTRITDHKIQCLYIHGYQIIKNCGPGPYNSLPHIDNRKTISGLSLT